MESMERLNYWKDKNVFVTGAYGFIGSNLTLELLRLGADVAVLKRDYMSGSLLQDNKEVNVSYGKLEDFDNIIDILAEFNIDIVFHLGAKTIVGNSKINPKRTIETNINGTLNILEACRALGSVKRIIVASTDKVYGDSKVPYTEDMPLVVGLPYDTSKTCADFITQCYSRVYNLPVCISRSGNVYGEGDLNFSRIIPHVIMSILRGKDIIIRSDGTPVREYFYVGDAVDSYITLVENMDKRHILGNAFNFSSGEKMTVIEVVNKIAGIMKYDGDICILNEAKDEIQEQILSIEKAKNLLGWKPKTKFDEGIIKTIGWYKCLK